MRAPLFAVAVASSALATLAAPASLARADEGANEVSVGPSTRALRSASADAITGDSLDGGGVAYARDLGISPIPRLSLWLDAGLAWGSASGTMFQTVATDLNTFELRAGGRARYQLHRVFAVGARLDVGTARASLTLGPATGQQLGDARWGGLVATSITGDVLLVDSPRFGLGVRVELGYVKASAIALTAAPTADSDGTIKLPMTDSSLGHLDLSGPTFGASVIGRF